MLSAMAAEATFSIPGLLEMIILHLPLRDIVKARAVCRAFANIIDGTRTIQRALFLAPSSQESLLWHVLKQTPHRLESGGASKNGMWKPNGLKENPTRYPILNPFFPIHPKIDEELYSKQWYAVRPRGLFTSLEERVAFRNTRRDGHHLHLLFPISRSTPQGFIDALSRSQGLFRDMALAHPPIKSISYDIYGCAIPLRIGLWEGIVTIGKLLRDSILNQEVVNRDPNAFGPLFRMQGGHRIAVLARTADEITGHEMLSILRSDVGELDEELFVRDAGSGKATFRL